MWQPLDIKLPPSQSKVLALLNEGQLDRAKMEAQALINSNPDHLEAQYAFGMVALISGRYEEAIDWIKKAFEQQSNNAVYACNLAFAYQNHKQTDTAIHYLSLALALDPKYAKAQYNLGSLYIENKQADLAAEQFRTLVKSAPDNMDYLCALADAIRENGKWRQASRLYNRVLKKEPEFARALSNVGALKMNSGKFEDAIADCKKAIEIEPNNYITHKNLGDCLIQLEQLEDAMEAYADAHDINPNSAELCIAIGKVWLDTHELPEAASWFHKAIQLDDGNIAALCGLANIEREEGNIDASIELLTPLLEKAPDDHEVLTAIADSLWEDGDAEGALEHLRHLQAVQPQRASLHAKVGQILSSAGSVPQALEEYKKALAQNPRCIPALNGFAVTERGKLDPSYVETMEKLLKHPRFQAGAKSSLHSGLGFYYDGIKAYEKSATHIRLANKNQWESRVKRGWEYSMEEYEAHIGKLIETYDTDYFERLKSLNIGNPDQTPVFIVAMPRSGTTLTEQILARHSKALGIGERNFAGHSLNAYIATGQQDNKKDFSRLKEIQASHAQQISQHYLARLQELKDKANLPNALRVIDKMPDNYSQLGWILTLFPNAKIIHCQRDPRDVALSCWMTQFGSIRWACHTDHLSHRILQYQRIMQHWRNIIPDRFIEFNYETLVANQEQESRRLIEYIGLEWEPQCLEFYDSDRIVRTASITQVRQPIYKKSVAKWKRYEPYLNDLFDALTPESDIPD
ncbi:sulfotransferase [Pseudomonadota bacterium]